MTETNGCDGNYARTFWSDAEMLECVYVHPETPNTASFTFRAPSGAMFDFKAGQFVTLEIPTPCGAVHRTYTISSSPSRPRTLTITAKAQENSIGTRWMLDRLKPGMRLKATGPLGVFSNAHSKHKKFLFIAAGSGITPMMSMATSQFDESREMDTVLINCANRPSELLFRRSLEHMASRSTGLDLKFVVNEPDICAPWTGYVGRLNQAMLAQMAPDFMEREVYCCGPEPFMNAVQTSLADLGYDMDGYKQESFNPIAPQSEVVVDVAPHDKGAAEIHFETTDVHHVCAKADTVLSAAKSAGVSIPTGCSFGLCGTCKIKKTKGEVNMTHNGGISEIDMEAGYILACCSIPIGKISVAI